MRESVGAFVEGQEIPLRVACTDKCAVRVAEAGDPAQCDLCTLYSGGWITCTTARAMASKLKIAPRQIGELLNHLNVKIRECELGCFK